MKQRILTFLKFTIERLIFSRAGYLCKMKFFKAFTLLFTILVIIGGNLSAQRNAEKRSYDLGIDNFDDTYRGSGGIRVGFYNVENLFDIYNDSLKRDDAFTPSGDYHWTSYKYKDKLKKLSRVITAMGGWEPIEVLGLCEVENRRVLIDLIKETALDEINYQIIHHESPDNRGIDVAMIYNADKIIVLNHRAIPVDFLAPDAYPTRDILYVEARFKRHVIHFFVNHWPSRYGGHLATIPKRNRAAHILRKEIEKIYAQDSTANIVVMGDFNDHPNDESMLKHLYARKDTAEMSDTSLFNMMYAKMGSEGTHKFQGKWGILDQFVVNGTLLRGKNGLQTRPENTLIFKADFLLTDDATHVGKKLYRTYTGFKYSGGYADHLPIILDLKTLQRSTK